MDFDKMQLMATDDTSDDDYDEEGLTFFEGENGNAQVLVIADLGLWYGRREGGRYGKLSSLLRFMYEDYNSIYYNSENGTFVLKAVHHDGTNYFTIYKLTQEGIDYLEEWGDYREARKHIIETEGMTTRFEIE